MIEGDEIDILICQFPIVYYKQLMLKVPNQNYSKYWNYTGGKNYRVGDKVVFNNEGTNGGGASAQVSRLIGKDVSSVSAATSTITGLSFMLLKRSIYSYSR